MPVAFIFILFSIKSSEYHVSYWLSHCFNKKCSNRFLMFLGENVRLSCEYMMFYEQFTIFTLFVLTEHMGKSFSRLGCVVNRCGLHCPTSPYTFSATLLYIPLPALPCFRLSSITHFLQVMSGISKFYFREWSLRAATFSRRCLDDSYQATIS